MGPLFASAGRHLETLLAEELRALGLPEVTETRAGVHFGGGLPAAYRVCLWSRVASRVLLPLAEFDAPDADALYDGARGIDWSAHLGPGQTLAVRLDSVRSGIEHGHYAALKVKDAICDQLREHTGARPSVDTRAPDISITGFLFRDRASLSLDLSGDALHRRGWRERAVAAPLKENLAAAVLLRAGWPRLAADGAALLDPMCGGGTLVIEAALMAADIAPGLLREHWGFIGWRGHDPALWAELLAEARERRAAGLTRLGRSLAGQPGRLRGSDQDPQAIAAARANAARAGLGGHVGFERGALADCRPAAPGQTGLVVVNPPYGERLDAEAGLGALYRQLGQVLREQFEGWQAAVLTGNPDLGKVMGLRARRFHTLYNGPIECRLLHFDVTPAAHVSDRPRALPEAERGPGAAMLANRLRKNERALARWRRDQGVSCYRLYDADLPEYALAIDLYLASEGGQPPRPIAHVQEYAAPPTVDPRDARRRLREAIGVIGEVLGLADADLHFKVRRPQKGNAQYERLDASGRFLEVDEDGLKLLINLDDYLDSGLFLDHRDTRRLVGQRAQGRRFLNLFAYTGSASVHAARGGARSTTSVDMSRTYLDWARRNLALNGFHGREHDLIQADCLDWLANARAYRRHFGLIFLDPPTFSTSKRMHGTFDVQRDHVPLLHATLALLADDGELIFSTNARKFRLDRDGLGDGLVVEDLTAATLPRDFARNPRIHQCFRICARAPASRPEPASPPRPSP